MKKSSLFIYQLFFCFFFFTVSSNSQTRSCGMVEYMNQQLQDPEFAREYQETQTRFRAALAQSLNNSNSNRRATLIIPVAVHYPSGLEADRACLEALAQSQIDILNADYTATNTDANLWSAASSFYPGTNHGIADIEFRIATKNHPANLDAELLEGNPAVTIGYNFGNGSDQDTNWSGYMNFLVKDIGSGLLGYSPLGGSISGGHTVVMNLGAFGSGPGCSGSSIVPSAPFNLGRTVTHELGHFFNLDHTFSGACSSDDGLSDTPNILGSNYNCPSNGSVNGCVSGEKALTMNYMDYVDDACMFMFTEGQITVTETYLAIIEADFKTNVLSVQSEIFEAFSVSPNPNKGSFNVTFQAASNKDVMITVFEIRGRKIYSNTFETNRNFNQIINLDSAQSGVYLMTISNGRHQVTKRIIIN